MTPGQTAINPGGNEPPKGFSPYSGAEQNRWSTPVAIALYKLHAATLLNAPPSMFGHGLDSQAADLIAAKAVREAMSASDQLAAGSLEDLVRALVGSGALDREIAMYVAVNPDRFVLTEAPQHIEARWCLGASRLAS